MATIRDFDQMLKAALDLKETAQKFIDFAKLQGAGEGGEGEEDLEEAPGPEDPMDEEEDSEEEEMPPPEEDDEPAKRKRMKHMAIILALKSKMGKK